MTVWIIILISVFIVCGLSAVYMTMAVGRFGGIRALSHGKRWLRRLLSFSVIAIGFAVIACIFDVVNAIIIFLHETIFFLLFGLAIRLIKRLRKQDFRFHVQGWGAIVFSIVYLSIAYILCNHVWLTEYSLTTEKPVGTVRIALLADSHVGTTFGGNDFAAHMKNLMAQNPDIVLIPGDYVDDGTTREDMVLACKALGDMHPKYGVWFSYGNHDRGYYGSEARGFSAEDLETELKKNSVHVLEDDTEIIDNLCIAGRADASTRRDRKDLSELLQGVDKSRYIIVLDHEPNDYEREAETGADLVVSGHTHGGQLFPVTYFGQWFGINDAVYGYERRNGTDFIVTSGISDWEILFKTGTKSEYVIIEVRSPDSA